jgi:hypothetical protein
MKSDRLNLLEPSGPVQACTGITLPFTLYGGMQNFVMLVKFVIESVVFYCRNSEIQEQLLFTTSDI